jgi:6-phosphogluconolactonase
MNNLRSFPESDQLDEKLAQHIAAKLAEDIAQRGAASLAVSGGSTPKGLFRRLSQCDIDWSRVTVTLVDERWVDRDSPDSNERLVRDKLLQHRAREATFLGLKTDHEHGEAGLGEIQRAFAKIPKPVSVMVLGMGGDGHTASWFPQADNLQQLLNPNGSDEVALTEPVTAPYQRITLTFPAVLNTKELIVHIVGGEKRAVLERAGQQGLPIAAILEQSKTPVTTWWAEQ